ncbi:hypothetical protein [Parapedobacter koreensis]|uniref:hypothetical protein n=1 Tax=Parapedobacter koreensis TaxID=332977 RepID=UPI000B8367B5|nr:hypothetical protein [Parapedobacter koreensis]
MIKKNLIVKKLPAAENGTSADVIYSISYRYLSASMDKHSGLFHRTEDHGRYWPPVAARDRNWPLSPYTSLNPSIPVRYPLGKQRV